MAHSPEDAISLSRGLLAILRQQAHRIRLNSRCALRRFHPEDLHDLRVAMRRFRAGLRLARRFWPEEKWSKKLAARLAAFSNAFGPLRDAQVRDEFLSRADIQDRCRADEGWANYRAECQAESRQAARKLRRILRSKSWQAALAEINRVLRHDLPRLADSDRMLFHTAAVKRLKRIYRRILKHEPLRRRMQSDEFHDLRRLCRRGRYLAEFLLNFHDHCHLAALQKRLKDICDALGDLHDADVHLSHLKARRDLPALCRALRAARHEAKKRFALAWRRIRHWEGELEV
ncbi:MAG: CHAD domain-containing protein [Planctomycetota bacterium]|nr:CHAD domain-containing protein [Planctomycetota bacterium]